MRALGSPYDTSITREDFFCPSKTTGSLTGAGKAMHIAAVFILLIIPIRVSAADFAFITTTDYSTGSSSVIHLDGSHTTEINVTGIHSDAVTRFFGDLVYVVNRMGGDNIHVLDPSDDYSTLRQFSVGTGSDPHDIAFVSETKAYVSRGNETELLIVDPSSGSHIGTIDLSSFSDADGIPEMDCMILIGDLLFVSIQRLDRNNYWLPVAPSYLAVIDTNADTLYDCDPGSPGVQPVELTGTDPFGEIHFDPYTGFIYLTTVGWWGMQDGGVELVDPNSLESTGFMLTESAAGGDINDVALFNPTIGYAVVTNSDFDNLLVRFDPSTGTLTDTLFAPDGYVLADIEISPGGELFLCDRTATDPGIRIYDAVTGIPVAGNPIDVGLPPFDICFSITIQTDAGTPAARATLGNFPNPFNPVTIIRFSVSKTGMVDLAIYDASGRLVRKLANRIYTMGQHEALWNGKDDRGLTVSSGIYFARLQHPGGTITRKLVLIR